MAIGNGLPGGVGFGSPAGMSAMQANLLKYAQPARGNAGINLPPGTPMGGVPVGQPMQQQPQPQYGLAGAEQALMSGFGGATSAFNQGMNQANTTLQGANRFAQGQFGQGQQALQQGNQFAQNQLAQGRQALGGNFSASAQQVNPLTGQPLFQQAAQGVGAYSPAGLQAQGMQSALSGAQGQQAFDNAFINSPVQQFLREQGQQSVINQATALGGLGGGEVQKELTRFGQGLAGTQLQQQIQNLNALSGQGLQAAGQQGQFLSQAGQQQGNLAGMNAQMGTQANIASANNKLNAANNIANLFGQSGQFANNLANNQANLFGQSGQMAGNLASQGAGYQMNAGNNIGNAFLTTGSNLGNARTRAGELLAGNVSGLQTGLSNLQNQQGSTLADLLGGNSTSIANLISGAGQFDSNQLQALASILSNLETGTSSQVAGLQSQIGAANAAGTTARADAITGLLNQGINAAANYYKPGA